MISQVLGRGVYHGNMEDVSAKVTYLGRGTPCTKRNMWRWTKIAVVSDPVQSRGRLRTGKF